jgi:hypothetical protein
MRLWHTGRDRGDLVVRLVERRALETTTQQKAPPIPVPERLVRPHAIVARIKGLSKPRPRSSGLDRLYASSRDLRRGLDVSESSLGRALRILQALITEGDRRGCEVHLDDRTGDPRVVGFTVKGHQFAVSVREKDGVLRVVLPSEYAGRRLGRTASAQPQRTSSATSSRTSMHRPRKPNNIAWSGSGKTRSVGERGSRRWIALESAMPRTSAAFIRDQVASWRLADDIQSFCSAARSATNDSEEEEAWLAWATKYADAIDPISEPLIMLKVQSHLPTNCGPTCAGGTRTRHDLTGRQLAQES